MPGLALEVYGEEGPFLLRPIGQNSWFERVGRTFGTAQYRGPTQSSLIIFVLVVTRECSDSDIGSARTRASLMIAPCHPLMESFGLKVSSWVVAYP